jgi:gluconokinase
MNDYPLVWIVMGVSGSGKTLIGRLLAEQWECDFLEGDRRHSLANVAKMKAQQPLQDEDRRHWLLEMEDDIRRAVAKSRETVMTCSALKVSYRHQLTSPGRVQLVWLSVPKPELERRLSTRSNHYMKPEMLESQLAAFEPIVSQEQVITIDGTLLPSEAVSELSRQAIERFPIMEKSWWKRRIE